MKYSLSVPSISGSNSDQSDQSSDVEENYQVQRVGNSSYLKEDQDVCDNSDAVVISEESQVPSFGSVSVVNSNDVHFGNKTVYQGPVTIKQFVYPNSAPASDSISAVTDTYILGDNLDKSSLKDNGIDNPVFVEENGSSNKNDKVVSPHSHDEQNRLPSVMKAVRWLQNLPKQRPKAIAIVLSGLLVSFTILVGIILWKQTPTIIQDHVYDGDTNEQDNNTPIDYISDSNSTINERLRMVSRLQWLAQPPIQPATPLKTPVSLVVIHHTATEKCSSQAQCVFHVRHIQSFHIESNQWWDIGYNFLVGGDGAAYEGRGWKSEGAHTFGYNYKSMGVAFIGTFINEIPPQNQIVAFKLLMAKGVELGFIKSDYKIIGARQVFSTESPGTALFKEIQKWPHWSEKP